MNPRLLAALGLTLLASCTNEVAGLTCRTNADCDLASWCDESVCVACEPLGTACTGPADAASPGRDAAEPGQDAEVGPGLDAEIVAVTDAAVTPTDAEVPADAGESPPGRDASEPPGDAHTPQPDVGVVVAVDGGVQVADGAVVLVDAGPSRPDAGPVAPDAGPAAGPDAAEAGPDAGPAAGPDAAEAGPDAGPTSMACSTYGNPLKGRCREGTKYLVDGAWGPCIGEVLAAPETCNGLDDDCNDATDEGLVMHCGLGACENEVSACVDGVLQLCPVAPAASVDSDLYDNADSDCDGLVDEDAPCIYVDGWGGSNASTGQDPNFPVASIKIGISNAGTLGIKRVCVTGSTQCAGGNAATYNEAVVMANGIHVTGGYSRDKALWTLSETCVTQIQAPMVTLAAVTFPSQVTVPTQLARFSVKASNLDWARAVEVAGSAGAILTDNRIEGGSGANSRAILVSGGRPRIERNAIDGGLGSVSSIGISASAAVPIIRLNCGAGTLPAATPPCTLNAEDSSLDRYVRGRSVGSGNVPGVASVGIDLFDCAGAVVSQNAIGAGGSAAHAVALRLSGKVDGIVVAQNTVRAVAELSAGQSTAGDYAGVLVAECAVAGQISPWLAGNLIAASSSSATTAVGVHSVGPCAPRVDANESVVGNLTAGAATSSFGVLCEPDAAKVPSPCVVERNVLVAGNSSSTSAFSAVAPTSRGVACFGGSCQGIEGNQKVTPGTAAVTMGVELQGGKTLVEANFIEAGCPQGINGVGMGLRTLDAAARVVNNVIRGMTDTCSRSVLETVAVFVDASVDPTAAVANEVDLHSNDLLGGAGTGSCTSSTLQFGTAVLLAKRGLVRNNIIQIGGCTSSSGVREVSKLQPRVFTNNDLYGGANLYDRPGVGVLSRIDDVNLKVGPHNVSDDPMWDAGYHVSAGKACIGSGTPDQAPDVDLYRSPRLAPFDMGAVKYSP
ncbi:MAG TPA: hypothetical protein VGK67_23975 [Myxococcales bacterium]